MQQHNGDYKTSHDYICNTIAMSIHQPLFSFFFYRKVALQRLSLLYQQSYFLWRNIISNSFCHSLRADICIQFCKKIFKVLEYLFFYKRAYKNKPKKFAAGLMMLKSYHLRQVIFVKKITR